MSTILIGFKPGVLTDAQLGQVAPGGARPTAGCHPGSRRDGRRARRCGNRRRPGARLAAGDRAAAALVPCVERRCGLGAPTARRDRGRLRSHQQFGHPCDPDDRARAGAPAGLRTRPTRRDARSGGAHLAAHGKRGGLRAVRQDAAPRRAGHYRPAHRTGGRSAGDAGVGCSSHGVATPPCGSSASPASKACTICFPKPISLF